MKYYNLAYYNLGRLSKLAGLASVVYGVFSYNIDAIVGGAVSGFIGNSITKECQLKEFARQQDDLMDKISAQEKSNENYPYSCRQSQRITCKD